MRSEGFGDAMPNWIATFVRYVDAMNYRIGRGAMYLFYVLAVILLIAGALSTAGGCRRERPTADEDSANPPPARSSCSAWMARSVR